MDNTLHFKLLKEVEEIKEAIQNLKKESIMIQLQMESNDLQNKRFSGEKRPILLEIESNSPPKKKQKTKNEI